MRVLGTVFPEAASPIFCSLVSVWAPQELLDGFQIKEYCVPSGWKGSFSRDLVLLSALGPPSAHTATPPGGQLEGSQISVQA